MSESRFRGRAVRLKLLPLAIAIIVATTMIPLRLRMPSLAFLDFSAGPSDVLNNVLLYIPLGFALWRRTFARALLTGCALSTLAEVLQLAYIDRDPSPVDVAANTFGAVAGYLVAHGALRFCRRLPEAINIPRSLAAIAGVCAVVGVWGLVYHDTISDFSNWDRKFKLALGEEITGEVQWKGSVSNLAIYANALEPSQFASIEAHGPDSLNSAQPLFATDSRWQIFPASSRIVSDPGVNQDIFERLTTTNRLSVVLSLKTNDVSQKGPARIITYSRDRYQRNFTLGQLGRALTFRLRTPNTGPNGTDPALFTRQFLRPGQTYFVAITYDGAFSRLYVDGELLSQLNIAAKRPRFPHRIRPFLPSALPIPELENNVSEVVIGALSALAVLGFAATAISRPAAWLIGLAAGAIPGLLIWTLSVSEPHLGLRVLALSVTGALLIVTATEVSRVQPEERRPNSPDSEHSRDSLYVL